MPSLGNLFVTLGANHKQLDDALDKTDKKLADTEFTMRSLVNQAGKLTLAAAGTGAAIIAGLVNSGRLAIDVQSKLAQSMDGTIGGLRAVEKAAGDAGVATEDLYNEASKLNGRLGDATRATGPAYEALKQLGLNAKTLLSLDIDQRFAAIADAMAKMNVTGGQAQDIMRDLGVRNENLANLIRQGGDAFREQAEEVRKLGLNLSMVDAAQVEEANKALDDMGDVLTVIKDRLAVASAPYLKYLADQFNNAAIESGGFKKIIDDVIKSIIKGFGKAGDFIQGLRVSFKIAEVAGQGFWAAMLSGAEILLGAYNILGDGIAKVVNVAIQSYNKIYRAQVQLMEMPSKSAFMEGLHTSAQEAREKVMLLNGELIEMANEELPSTKAQAMLDAVAKASIENAKKVVEARKSMMGGAVAPSLEDTAPDDKVKQDQYKKDMEAWNTKNATELEALKERYMTEQQLLMEHRDEMNIIGSEYDAKKFESEEQWRSVSEQAETAYQQRLADFAIAQNKRKRDAIDGILGNLTVLMNTHSRRAFEVGKAAAIAQTIMSTYEAAQKSYSSLASIPYVGPVLGAAAAVAAIAAGMARVSAIRSQSFGGGGGAAATGSNTAAVNAASTPVGGGGSGGAGGGQTLTVAPIDPNAIFSGSAMQSFGQNLVNFQKDGGKVIFSA